MKLLLQILLILLVVSTVCICAIKPNMHKSVIVYNSDYTIVPEEVAVVEKEEIPIMEIPVTPTPVTTKVEKKAETAKVENKVQQTKTVQKQQPVKTTEKVVKKTETPKAQTTVKPVTKTVETPKTTVSTVNTQTPKTTTVEKVETKPTTLTEQQEEIAWNVWRSNLQNRIMEDVNLPFLPEGIVFKFSFNVDKYGKISNVQTWSTASAYTPYAIQYIAPVIRSYQGKSILNFPQGSTRVSTEVKGGWKLSSVERYSTPKDYNDVEKIVK